MANSFIKLIYPLTMLFFVINIAVVHIYLFHILCVYLPHLERVGRLARRLRQGSLP